MINSYQTPSLNFLNIFESVARHLSFTLAAKELFITQAAVSPQIKVLEDYLEAKLFFRENRKVFLTSECQKLLPGVVSGLQVISDSLESIRNYKKKIHLSSELDLLFKQTSLFTIWVNFSRAVLILSLILKFQMMIQNLKLMVLTWQ
tara:strand:+ start:174 stop:614 length:441 start_codon:yes stop_codon:yes gene_type:complete